jgi:hypothetical protein
VRALGAQHGGGGVSICPDVPGFAAVIKTAATVSSRMIVSAWVGRKRILLVFSLTLLTAYPALARLVAAPTSPSTLMVVLWLSFLYGSYNGAMVVALTEIVPVEIRTAGFSPAYALAMALFGGFIPLDSTWLIEATGTRLPPACGWPSRVPAGWSLPSWSTAAARFARGHCAKVRRRSDAGAIIVYLFSCRIKQDDRGCDVVLCWQPCCCP